MNVESLIENCIIVSVFVFLITFYYLVVSKTVWNVDETVDSLFYYTMEFNTFQEKRMHNLRIRYETNLDEIGQLESSFKREGICVSSPDH